MSRHCDMFTKISHEAIKPVFSYVIIPLERCSMVPLPVNKLISNTNP